MRAAARLRCSQPACAPVMPGLRRRLVTRAVDDLLEREADRAAEQVLHGRTTRGSGSSDSSGSSGDSAIQLSRRAQPGSAEAATDVPASVQATVDGSGAPLDSDLQAEFGTRFAHDFSRVRVHKDAAAARSARAVHAQAYTVGTHIVFDVGQYAPSSSVGRHLLAHELAHVVQQSGMPAGTLQRQSPRPAPVDADAQRIIDLAQEQARPIAERAVAVVQAIIDQHYAAERSKISRIRYRADESGLRVTYAGRGTATTGQIDVGRYFVENTTARHFARRVAQVRHEIEHVEQQRAGMTGESRQDEREFLAFYHEALFQEPVGTGRMQHSTRVTLLDAALGYYRCLAADLQRDHQSKRDELLTRRSEAVRRSGRSDAGEPPTTCMRQAD